MKWVNYIGWIAFFVLLFLRGCEKEPKIEIKEVVKTLPPDTIVKEIPVKEYIKVRGNDSKLINDIAEMRNIIEWQQEEFAYSDSVQKAELYKLATELKAFQSDFEDENLKLQINGLVSGSDVKEITPTYTLKVKEPKKRNHFFIGAGVNSRGVFDANISLQNKKSDIIELGIDNQRNINVGFKKKLF